MSAHAFEVLSRARNEITVCHTAEASDGMASKRAMPPPGRTLSSTAARVALSASSTRSFQTKNAAEPSPSILAIGHSSTPAEQKDQHKNNQNCAHYPTPFQIPAIASGRSEYRTQYRCARGPEHHMSD
jgi:hypothetical protein